MPLSQIGRRSYVDLSVRAAARPAFMWGALDYRDIRTPVCLTSAGSLRVLCDVAVPDGAKSVIHNALSVITVKVSIMVMFRTVATRGLR